MAAVTDIRCFFQTQALLFHKGGADLVAFDAGGTAGVTDDNFPTDVGAFALEALRTEVVRVIEDTLWLDIIETVEADLFGDRGGILAEVASDLLKRKPIIEGILDKAAVV